LSILENYVHYPKDGLSSVWICLYNKRNLSSGYIFNTFKWLRLLTSQQRKACWERRHRAQNCSRPLRLPVMNWKQQFWIYGMRIASVNSTTAAQPVFMTCPGSVNALSIGNTLRYVTFFSALKEFTSCHNTAGSKNPMVLLCTNRTNVRTYVRTCIHMYIHTYTHTHTKTCVNRTQAQRPTRTFSHTHIHTHTNTRAHFRQEPKPI
jgi:hypothetical protein